MDLNEYDKRFKKLEKKVDGLNENIQILTQVFEGVIEQFDKIKKDLKK